MSKRRLVCEVLSGWPRRTRRQEQWPRQTHLHTKCNPHTDAEEPAMNEWCWVSSPVPGLASAADKTWVTSGVWNRLVCECDSVKRHDVPPFDFGIAYEILSRFCDSEEADTTHRRALDAIRQHGGSLLAALGTGLAQPSCPEDGLFVVIEGLDGVGKTTLVETVCELLSSSKAAGLRVVRAIRTPPEELLCHRAAFDILGQNSVVRRAFYALGNFIAAEIVREELHRAKLAGEQAVVICDRFHLSTAAYYLWQREDVRSKDLFNQSPWPDGLLLPTLCVHVELEETERTKRLHARCAGSGNMTGEEQRLSERDRAEELKALYCELGRVVHTMYPAFRFERLDITGLSRHEAGESFVALISACSY